MLAFILEVTDGDEANPDAVRAVDTGIHTATQHRPMAVILFRRGGSCNPKIVVQL